IKSFDALGNISSISNVAIAASSAPDPSDILPPRVSLTIFGLSFSINGTIYTGTGAQIGFQAVDDFSVAGDSAGIGVASIFYSLNGSAFAAFASPISLAPGANFVSYYATDKNGRASLIA